MTVHVCVRVVHVLMHVLCMCWCMCVQHEIHEVCLVMHSMARWGTKWVQCVNTQTLTKTWSIRIDLNIRTQLSPIQHKNVTRTFCQTPSMQQWIPTMNNAWTWRNLPQYIRLPQGANTDTQTSNGTQPNKRFWKFFTKTKNPNPIFENPQFLKPNLNFCIISEKHEENGLEKTYLEVGNAENKLESDGVWVKNGFGLREVWRMQCEGNKSVLKTCHICYIKSENTRFSRVRQ